MRWLQIPAADTVAGRTLRLHAGVKTRRLTIQASSVISGISIMKAAGPQHSSPPLKRPNPMKSFFRRDGLNSEDWNKILKPIRKLWSLQKMMWKCGGCISVIEAGEKERLK